MKLVVAAVLVSVPFALGNASAGKKDEVCKQVAGPFSSIVVSEGCESPVGICTHGLLTGNFHATYDFTMTSLVPSDPNDPSAFVYTGESVITTRGGQKMFSHDTGIMHIQDPTAVPFVTTANIYSGDHQYQGGQFVASGLLNFITGEAVGSYTGEICKEK